MTISSTTRVAGPFIGAGTTATFPFTFKVFEPADLYVVTLDVATSAITVLALTTNYTVALNADQDTSPGGSITLTAGNLATGLTLTITTDMAELQNLDLANGGAFYPDTINAALDTLTILVQQLALRAALALQLPLTDYGATVTLPPAAERAGMMLMFDADGNPALISVAPGGTIPGAQAATGTVDGVNTTFSFTASAESMPVPLVFAGGVFQTPGTDYGTPTLQSGSTWQIVFTAGPAQGPITVLLLA
jgi:hypothetical protein